ncbi:hypothetical protein AERO9A_350023 [Aeromonas salmonicida]|nr:hypothetical protein AERO9A_350023 [Aeromonas salmonicida]
MMIMRWFQKHWADQDSILDGLN